MTVQCAIFCRTVKGEYTGMDATHIKLDFQEVGTKFIIIFTPIQYASIALKTTAKHILKFAF
jgi:hypothetical protein